MRGMAPLLVREGVRRDGFLATLGSRPWRARPPAASALGDPRAVSGRAAYAAWLRRNADAWSRLPLPPRPGAEPWLMLSVGSECLGGHVELPAGLADLGGRTAPARRDGAADEAFLVGAAHVAVVAAGDAAVLADGAAGLGGGRDGPLGPRFVIRCRELARSRTALRRELAAWAADRDPETAER